LSFAQRLDFKVFAKRFPHQSKLERAPLVAFDPPSEVLPSIESPNAPSPVVRRGEQLLP